MARLAAGRDHYLTAEEIATEALRMYDEGSSERDLSIRKLAARLEVSPAAIYYVFDGRDAIVEAAVGIVWDEAIAALLAAMAEPTHDPDDLVGFLVTAALHARRAFLAHYRIAQHIAAAPVTNSEVMNGALAVYAAVFEQLGLAGERAGDAFFAYATYCFGSILFSAARRLADEGASAKVRERIASLTLVDQVPDDAPPSSPDTLVAVDRAVRVTRTDAEEEERQFAVGLRALLAGLLVEAAPG